MNHEKLECYQVALAFVQEAGQAMRGWPKGYGFLTDQLKRAGASIVLNIAEGNSRFGVAERRQFFRIAKGSTAECAACLDVAQAHSLSSTGTIKAMKHQLLRVSACLPKCIDLISSSILNCQSHGHRLSSSDREKNLESRSG